MIATLVPLIIWLVPFFLLLGILNFWRTYLDKQNKRSPLSQNLLRSPGESLRKKIEDINGDLASYLAILPTMPLFMFSIYLSRKVYGGEIVDYIDISLLIVFAVVIFIYSIIKVIKNIKIKRKYQLGYEAETAVGQELNQLLLDGYRVFHDFPAEKFNIDHVVIGNNGVFAVETKGRSKPLKAQGAKSWVVEYNGKDLKFPMWREKDSLEQAQRQAKWLQKWLSSAVGESVDVLPVLMLPGWFIERTAKPAIAVDNGKDPQKLFRQLGNKPISDKLQTQIVHQLEQKCRDISPTAYKVER